MSTAFFLSRQSQTLCIVTFLPLFAYCNPFVTPSFPDLVKDGRKTGNGLLS